MHRVEESLVLVNIRWDDETVTLCGCCSRRPEKCWNETLTGRRCCHHQQRSEVKPKTTYHLFTILRFVLPCMFACRCVKRCVSLTSDVWLITLTSLTKPHKAHAQLCTDTSQFDVCMFLNGFTADDAAFRISSTYIDCCCRFKPLIFVLVCFDRAPFFLRFAHPHSSIRLRVACVPSCCVALH